MAARLEPLAEPGGVSVASIVNESVGNRIDVSFKDGGEVQVKNIDRPIRIWKWSPGDNDGTAIARRAAPTKSVPLGEPRGRGDEAACQDRPACRGAGFFGQSLRSLSLDRRKMMINPGHPRLSIPAVRARLDLAGVVLPPAGGRERSFRHFVFSMQPSWFCFSPTSTEWEAFTASSGRVGSGSNN